MNNFEKINADFFDSTCEKFKDSSWEACCYLDEFMQDLYYHSIFKNINKNFSTILDVGCGQGDLLSFLKRNTCKAKYTGIDVSSKMVSICKTKYPDSEFNQTSYLDFESQNFDVILSVGTFNLRVSDKEEEQIEYLLSNIKKMYNQCNKVCSFTLMSKHGNRDVEKELFCYEPSKIMDYCLSLTSSVLIDHSSIPIDFIVTLYKED